MQHDSLLQELHRRIGIIVKEFKRCFMVTWLIQIEMPFSFTLNDWAVYKLFPKQ